MAGLNIEYKKLLIADVTDDHDVAMLDGELMLHRDDNGNRYLKVGKPGDATTFADSDLVVYLDPYLYV